MTATIVLQVTKYVPQLAGVMWLPSIPSCAFLSAAAAVADAYVGLSLHTVTTGTRSSFAASSYNMCYLQIGHAAIFTLMTPKRLDT